MKEKWKRLNEDLEETTLHLRHSSESYSANPPAEAQCFQRQLLFPAWCSCRVFVPNYVSKVKVQLVNCSTRNQSSDACPVVLKIRARAPPVHNSSALDCRERKPCQLEAAVPAWEHWYYVLVERYLTSSDVYFRIGVQVTGEAVAGTPSVFVSRWFC